MRTNFNVYKWRRDQLNEEMNKYQEYPKNKIGEFEYVFLPKKSVGGGIELYKTSEINFESIPNEITYTGEQYSDDTQKSVPVFLFSWVDYKAPEIDYTPTADGYNKTADRYQGD